MKKKVVFFIITFFIIIVFLFFRKMNSEVLDAFGIMNEKFEKSNKSVQSNLDSLALKVSYTDYGNKLKTLDSLSENLTKHIKFIKRELVENLEDPSNYSIMDKSTENDKFFFINDDYSSEGYRFINNLESYRYGMKHLFQEDFPETIKKIDSRFNYREDISDWLDYNFKGFPLIAVITKLTSMQSDIQQIKQDLLVDILAN